jgi:lipoprotein signal peptidase
MCTCYFVVACTQLSFTSYTFPVNNLIDVFVSASSHLVAH